MTDKKLDKLAAEERLQQLKKEIRHHDHQYYVLDAPEV